MQSHTECLKTMFNYSDSRSLHKILSLYWNKQWYEQQLADLWNQIYHKSHSVDSAFIIVSKNIIQSWKNNLKKSVYRHSNRSELLITSKDWHICNEKNKFMALESVVNVSDHFDIIDQFWHILNASQYLTVSQLVSYVCLIIPLNKKQEIVALRVFQHYLDKVYLKARTECTNQLFFYMRGEDGVEKNQIIKTITTELQMLNY